MSLRIKFTSAQIIEQRMGGPDEMLDAELQFEATFPGGQCFSGATRIKQMVGSDYKSKLIEVSPPTGLPSDREIPWDQFSEAARAYYAEKIVKIG